MKVDGAGSRIKRLFKRNALLIKILSSYLVVVIILLSFFSFVLFHTYSKKSIEQVSQTSENFISQSYYIADLMLINVYYYFYHLFVNDSDRDLSYGLYAHETDIFADQDVLKKLRQYVMSNPLTHSIYLYNGKADRVIFNISETGQGIQKTADFLDQDILHRLRDPEHVVSDQYFTRKVEYVINHRTLSENFLTLVLTHTSNQGKVESALVINLNQSILQQMVTSGNTGDLNQVLIMYKNGDVLSHDDTAMINQNLAHESFTKQVMQSSNERGSFITKIHDKESLVSYVKAKHLGLIFIGIGDYNRLLSSAYSMQKTLLILTFIFILIGIILSVFFTSSIYNPFRKMLQKYKLDSNKLLVDKKKVLLGKLVDGEWGAKEEDKAYMKESGIPFHWPFFLVIVFKMDSLEKVFSGRWSKDAKLVKFAMLNIAGELFHEKSFTTEGIDNGNDYVSIIVNIEEMSDEIEKHLFEITKEIQYEVDKYLKIPVSAGIGNIVEGAGGISKSFQHALAALNYQIIFGRKAVIAYDDIAKRNDDDLNEYPYDMEKRMIEAIKERNLKKAEASLNEFFESLARYRADEIRITVLQLAVSLTRVLSNITRTSIENGEYSIKVLVSEIQSCETLDEIKAYLQSLFFQAIDTKVETAKENTRTIIVNKIKDYVDKNYTSMHLSTDTIAEHVELSSNYARSIFKEIMGMSLSDYVTQCRMTEAQRLLMETNYPVGKIAELVGYPESSKHFFTVFKKHVGKTPESYRMSVQHDED
ncbi:helix-turn-helix domain-containing protein [Paenibacillus sp. 1P07SE]|uniref:helix-turn-helix domain-containing protein n=1 Tax=Paenibacillus sp. 1P07SE TaxID=3132209 RepID=UPI0039A561E6